jgi:hypothetical protein
MLVDRLGEEICHLGGRLILVYRVLWDDESKCDEGLLEARVVFGACTASPDEFLLVDAALPQTTFAHVGILTFISL